MSSGNEYGDRWGLKGIEDLGAGLQAIFTLEAGYAIANGAIGENGSEFGRQAFVQSTSRSIRRRNSPQLNAVERFFGNRGLDADRRINFIESSLRRLAIAFGVYPSASQTSQSVRYRIRASIRKREFLERTRSGSYPCCLPMHAVSGPHEIAPHFGL